jgi:hypothetical protein
MSQPSKHFIPDKTDIIPKPLDFASMLNHKIGYMRRRVDTSSGKYHIYLE